MSAPKNPPIFPDFYAERGDLGGFTIESTESGVTLRDIFALAALAGLLSYIGDEGPNERENAFLQGLKTANAARAAFQFADAMLAERAKS